MVEHEVEHKVDVAGEFLHVLPGTERFVYRPIVDHRKPPIGAVRAEGEDVHRAQRVGELRGHQCGEGLKRALIVADDRVAIGDERNVLFAKALGWSGKLVADADR